MKNVYYLMQELLQLLNNWCKTLCTNFTLKTEDNTKLSKLLSEGFKRPIYWNQCKVILKSYNNEYIRERIDASFHGVDKLFVLPYASGNDITNEN